MASSSTLKTVLLRPYRRLYAAPSLEVMPGPSDMRLIEEAIIEKMTVVSQSTWDGLRDDEQYWLTVGKKGVGMVCNLSASKEATPEPYETIAKGHDILKPGSYPVYDAMTGKVLETFEVRA